MSKSRSRTTGIPARTKRVADTRKYRSRSEREAAYNRLVLIVAGVITAIVILILAIAVLLDTVIRPNLAVANAGGQNISVRDFQRRVIFERWRSGTFLATLYNTYSQQFGAQYAAQLLSDTQNSPYASTYVQLASSVQMGQTVLQEMTDANLIAQYARANNITVTDDDINNRVYQFFGYQPTAMTETPTTTPSITLTPLVSPTPTTTPTATPVPSQTATPTATGYPTGIPTPTLGPTALRQQFDQNSKDYFDRAAKATGLTEAEIRQIFTEDALRQKVNDAIVGKAPDQQDQLKLRQIVVVDEAKAKDVMTALQQGESFSDLAKAVSTDTSSNSQGGGLGWQGQGTYTAQYGQDFENAIWNKTAKIGDVLGPIKDQSGSYHVVQIEGHEQRTLTDTQKSSLQTKKFNDWLTQLQKDKGVQTFDIWTSVVPNTPTLTDLGLPNPSDLSGGSGIPGQ